MDFEVEEALKALERCTPLVPTDDIIEEPILQVNVQGIWVATDRDIWEAWTGLRRKNGEDYHGDVHPITTPEATWTGPRVCSCATCQSKTDPKYRPN